MLKPRRYNVDLNIFEYPEGETALTASFLLHDNDNPTLVRNEEVNVGPEAFLSSFDDD